MECLSIDILCFVVINFIRIWIFVGISYFISQLFIIIQKFSSSNIKFFFIKDVFFWVKLRSFWWSHTVVKFFIRRFCHVCDQGFRSTVMRYCYSYFCFHCIVWYSCVCTLNLCYSVLVSTFLTLLVFKGSNSFTSFISVIYWIKLDLASCIVGCSRNHNIVAVFQLECEFVSFQFTTFQFLSEVKFYWDWNTVDTFFSWFVWFFNSLAYWVVVVNDLCCLVFNICTSYDIVFHCCWDIELVVTSEFEFSCIDHLCVFSVAKWLREAIFQVSCQNTIVIRDIEFRRNVCTSNGIVNFDVWRINSQFILVVVICDSYCLDIVFVVCVKFSCIQPYLVVKFLTTFNCLSIQVFIFVVGSCIDIWICVCFTIFICQFRIVINELRTCNIEFRFRNNVFLWLELRLFWRANCVIKFFIGNISDLSN